MSWYGGLGVSPNAPSSLNFEAEKKSPGGQSSRPPQGFSARFPPLTLVAYDIDCADLVDLSTTGALRRHQTSRAELACAWLALAAAGREVPSWRLAERLRGSGAAGLIVPSFAVGADATARNLVLWRWGDAPQHAVRVFDPDHRLPRDARSWREDT